jgi:hypothetical protein
MKCDGEPHMQITWSGDCQSIRGQATPPAGLRACEQTVDCSPCEVVNTARRPSPQKSKQRNGLENININMILPAGNIQCWRTLFWYCTALYGQQRQAEPTVVKKELGPSTVSILHAISTDSSRFETLKAVLYSPPPSRASRKERSLGSTPRGDQPTSPACSSWLAFDSCVPHGHRPLRAVKKKKRKKPALLVRERTIPAERQPLVGEVNDNFCGWWGVA